MQYLSSRGGHLCKAVKTRPLSEKQQATLDKINQYARENLMGLRVIRAFAREEFQEERFAGQNAVYAANSNRLFKLTGLTDPLFVQIIIAMIVAIVWFALDPIKQGSLQIGDLVAFIEYIVSTPSCPSFSYPISSPCILVQPFRGTVERSHGYADFY